MGNESKHVIYLSPPRSFYSDEQVTRGMVGMTPWVLHHSDAEMNRLREIWNGKWEAVPVAIAMQLLAKTQNELFVLFPEHRVLNMSDGDFLTYPSASLTVNDKATYSWEVKLLHPRKGGDGMRGDWMYLSARRSLFHQGTINYAYCPHTGKRVNEILVPVIYPADGWTGKYLRNATGGFRSTLEHHHDEQSAEIKSARHAVDKYKARLREYAQDSAYGLPASKDAPRHLRGAIAHQEQGRRNAQRTLVKLEQRYNKELPEIAKAQHLADTLVLERGWKAMILAGMQAMELTLTQEGVRK